MNFHEEERKKKYVSEIIELLIGRCYDFSEISDTHKKTIIRTEAEVFYRDHIPGSVDSEASHHNIEKRFPNLNIKLRSELSLLAEKMEEADSDIQKTEEVIKSFGISANFASDKLKNLLNN